ncbi:hypothetical protein [Anaerosporobacter sp.]|nr:hypothetical protein [Anaerosporobacter sp.]
MDKFGIRTGSYPHERKEGDMKPYCGLPYRKLSKMEFRKVMLKLQEIKN